MTELGLEARVQRIEDEITILRLMNAYGKRADEFDWVGWGNTYAEDALDEFEGAFGVSRGRQEITERARNFMDPVYDDFVHYIVNVDIDVDGDTAVGTGNIIFVALTDETKPTQHYMAGGRYRWTFARTSEGWRITHKKLRFIWNNGADAEDVFVPRQ